MQNKLALSSGSAVAPPPAPVCLPSGTKRANSHGKFRAASKARGRNDDAARETAHAFFESVLTGGLGSSDPGRGRFRSYLLGALKHFLAKHRAAVLTGKRGGGMEHVPLVSETDTAPRLPLPGKPDDELGFDREWALALLVRALHSPEQEHAHKPEFFAALKPWLDGGATAPLNDPADVADELRHPIAVAGSL